MSLLEKMPFLKARNFFFFCFHFAKFYGGNCPVKTICSHKTPQNREIFLIMGWINANKYCIMHHIIKTKSYE